jgi:NitT/TauT family transport system substrate-binding protein
MKAPFSRRQFLSSGASLAALPMVLGLPVFSAHAEAAALRIASVKFGSLAWLLETIKAEGLDKKHGLALDIVEIATNQSSPVALYGGNADVVVSDWTWGLRQRGMGEAIRFSPFSSALGAVMVPEASPIKSIADLKGKRLGVAGSAIDKSWLLLRAYSKRLTGEDLASLATPQFGAAPLLAEQIKDGRIDAVLNFWTYAARLEGHGFRRVISMADVMKELGIAEAPAMVGFIWKEASIATHGPAIEALLKAVREANALLATSDQAWDRLRPMMKAGSDAEFAALRNWYRSGIPGPWDDKDMKAAEKIMAILVESGDTELVGNGTRFDPKLFHTSGT